MQKKDNTGATLLIVSSILLLALAISQGYVSYRAQFVMVFEIKGDALASTLEALGLDCAAVIFSLLAIANARTGRRAIVERILSVACVSVSMMMNLAGSDGTPRSVMVYALPAALYAATSDRLIAVVRNRYLDAAETLTEPSRAIAERSEPASPPVSRRTLRSMTKTGQVQLAIQALGLDASAGELQTWIEDNGGFVPKGTVSSVLAKERKKARTAEEENEEEENTVPVETFEPDIPQTDLDEVRRREIEESLIG